MITRHVGILLEAANRSLAAWSNQSEEVQSEQKDIIAALRNAVIATETALSAPVVVDIHKGCGGTLGYDAWVDSNGEVCGGPFDHYVCMKCEEEEPDYIAQGVPMDYADD